MSYDHQSHIQRPHLNEWCGGTEPPTRLVVNKTHGEVFVEIYEANTNLHAGELVTPVDSELFLTSQELGPKEIGELALRALQSKGL